MGKVFPLCPSTSHPKESIYGFRLNLVVSDSIRADASRKKYGFCDMDAQAALSRLCRKRNPYIEDFPDRVFPLSCVLRTEEQVG